MEVGQQPFPPPTPTFMLRLLHQCPYIMSILKSKGEITCFAYLNLLWRTPTHATILYTTFIYFSSPPFSFFHFPPPQKSPCFIILPTSAARTHSPIPAGDSVQMHLSNFSPLAYIFMWWL